MARETTRRAPHRRLPGGSGARHRAHPRAAERGRGRAARTRAADLPARPDGRLRPARRDCARIRACLRDRARARVHPDRAFRRRARGAVRRVVRRARAHHPRARRHRGPDGALRGPVAACPLRADRRSARTRGSASWRASTAPGRTASTSAAGSRSRASRSGSSSTAPPRARSSSPAAGRRCGPRSRPSTRRSGSPSTPPPPGRSTRRCPASPSPQVARGLQDAYAADRTLEPRALDAGLIDAARELAPRHRAP